MSHSNATTTATHIPMLSEDEKIFLNTAATYSQVRRMSNNSIDQHQAAYISARPGMEENSYRQRRNQVVSVSSLSLLWKRRDSSASTCSLATAGSVADQTHNNMTSQSVENDYSQPESPKAKELESLIFEQPQRTVRLSLTPGCAV